MTRRAARSVVALGVAALLSSCVRLPTSGPVVDAHGNGLGTAVEGPYSHPPPPQQGDSPQEIVKGFLNAMTATPIQINVASKFLTPHARASWRPQARTIVYLNAPVSGGLPVNVRLQDAHTLGPRGEWEGRLPRHQSTISLPMRAEAPGRWRIAAVPNAFIVPDLWYQQHFQAATLYFFDPTGRILVPEPVYLPQGDQLLTVLVRALLLGPQESLSQVTHSYIPPGLTAPFSVTVSSSGVAEVTLRGPDPGAMPESTTELMLAQFAWTLRQEPSVRSFQVTIAGRHITDASGSSTFSVHGFDNYDPTDNKASAQLYALRNGRLVSGQANRLTPVDGPFGTGAPGIGSFAVSLDDTHIAGVTPYRLLVGAVRGGGQVHEAYAASGSLLRPSWDFAGRLWDVERSPHGARVLVIMDGTTYHVQVPGISGTQVKRFLVSRDGSRLVAVVRARHADRIRVSRLRYDARGKPLGATDTLTLPWRSGGSSRITDLGWVSPTTIVVLHHLSRQDSEVREISVDGSTAQGDTAAVNNDLTRPQGVSTPGSSIFQGRVKGLATSPVDTLTDTQTSFAILPRSLVDLDQSAGVPPIPYRNLHFITYAG